MNAENAIWLIQRCEGAEYVNALLSLLLPEYSRIFGKELMFNEKCIVYNDPNSSCPMLVTNRNPVMIRLSQTSLQYWAQTIFQLSHEMCHYAIRQAKHDKNFTLTWFEEILCEAMSLYALEYTYKNWSECSLSVKYPTFNNSVQSYLRNELKEVGSSLHLCKTLQELRECNEYCCDERDSHRTERNFVYAAISKNPLDAKCFLDYEKYVDIKYKLTIDFDRWERDNPCYLVRVLRYTQPNIDFSKELTHV